MRLQLSMRVAALLLLPLVTAWQLSVLHVNDIHARMEETNKYSGPCTTRDAGRGKCYGGLARVVTAVRKVKTQDQGSEGVVWLNTGDFFQGTLWYTLFKSKIVTKMSAMLDFDATTLGNHEFDDGVSGLEPFLRNQTCPVVVSNMNFKEMKWNPDSSLFSNSSELNELYNSSYILHRKGRKIGLVGYLTPDTIFTSSVPANLVLEEEVEALTREVEKLTAAGVDIIIALGHSGYLMDKKIAEEVPNIDIIVGAHSHSFLFTQQENRTNPSNNIIEGDYPTVVINKENQTVLVVQALAFTKYLGHLKVNFTEEGLVESWQGSPILLDNSFSKDPEVEAALEPGKKELNKQRLHNIGRTDVLLFTSRQVESTLGNLVTDAMVKAFRNKRDAEGRRFLLAIHHSGGIRTNLPAGNITLGGLMTVLPFEQSFDSLSLSGRYIREAFEKSAEHWQAKAGTFLQVSGFKVIYNLTAEPRSRVIGVQVLGDEGTYEDLLDEKMYSVVVSQYIARGGDGYTCIADNKENYQIGDLDTDVLRNYLQTHSPVRPGLEGRIKTANHCICDC